MLRVNFVFISFLCISLLSVHIQSVHSCLWKQENPSDKCLASTTIQNLQDSPQIAFYLCPIILNRKMLQKAEQICKFTARDYLPRDTTNMYNLIQTYLKRGKYIQAIQTQYQAFWINPFKHEQRLRVTLDNFKNYTANNEDNPQQGRQTSKLDAIVKNIYESNYKQAKKQLREFFDNHDTNIDIQQFWQFLPQLLDLRLMDKLGEFPDGLQTVTTLIQSLKKQKLADQILWFLYHIKGNFLMHHIRYAEAQETFKQSITQLNNIVKQNKQLRYSIILPPIFPMSVYNLALSLQKMNKYSVSMTYLKNLIQHPYFSSYMPQDCSDCYNALGFAYYQKGLEASKLQQKQYNFKQAHKYYDLAQKYQKEGQYLATFNVGVLFLQQRNYKKALWNFKDVLQINPEVTSAKYGLFKSQYHLDHQKGLTYLQQLEKDPKINLFQLSKILYQLGDREKCLHLIQLYDQNIKKSEKSLSADQIIDIFTWKGLIEWYLQKNQRAKQSFETVLAINKQKAHPQVLRGLATILTKQQQNVIANLERAISLFQDALKLFKEEGSQLQAQQVQVIIQKTQLALKQQQKNEQL